MMSVNVKTCQDLSYYYSTEVRNIEHHMFKWVPKGHQLDNITVDIFYNEAW